MKTLIVYKSHHGSTEKAAAYLQQRLGTELTDVIELKNGLPQNFDEYEKILIGGSIHAGHIQRKIKKFCEKYLPELLNKKVGLFMCFMDMAQGAQEFDEAYPEELRNHAIAKGLFGGEYLFDKMNFIERFLVRKITGETESKSSLDYDAMDAFADTMLNDE